MHLTRTPRHKAVVAIIEIVIIPGLKDELRLDPQDATDYSKRGGAYITLGSSFEAMHDLDEAIRRNPEDYTVYNKTPSFLTAPRLLELYSGKLIAHFGTSHPDYFVPSYDYIGITLDHHRLDLDAFRTVIGANLDHLVKAARASEAAWLVAETYFFWSEVADPYREGNHPHERKSGEIGEWEDHDEVARLRDLQDDYFRVSLQEYGSRIGGRGMTRVG